MCSTGLRLLGGSAVRLSGADVNATTFHSLKLDWRMSFVGQFQLRWTEPVNSDISGPRWFEQVRLFPIRLAAGSRRLAFRFLRVIAVLDVSDVSRWK